MTPSITFAPLSLETLEALIVGDLEAARALSGAPLTEYFTDDLVWLWKIRVEQLRSEPERAEWIASAVISVPDGEVVGVAGFHGPPDDNGMVEVSYSVDPRFRRRGYAKAMLGALIERATSDPRVAIARASISPDNQASLATIAGFGFTKVGEQWDDEDGLELLFELPTQQGSTMSDEIRKGLDGVVADSTAISKVNPETNSLLYRGYPVQELAAKCTFEEVAYLLWHGELPTGVQLEEFQQLERSLRPLDARTKRIIDELPLTAHPMDVVRTAVSVIGATDPTLLQHNGLTDRKLNEGRAI
jgi:RimJ/RimL family protein N-acetyltransferase